MSKSKKTKTTLIINGQPIPLDDHGYYDVDSDLLGQMDLSKLPVGTVLRVMEDVMVSQNQANVWIQSIRIKRHHSASVVGTVSLGNHNDIDGPDTTVYKVKSARIAKDLLQKEATSRPDFRVTKRIDGIFSDMVSFWQEIDAGSLDYIKQQVFEVVVVTLQPLLDFLKAVDDECLAKFGK